MRDKKYFLRKKYLLERRKRYFKAKKFNYNLIFNLIKYHFKKKKITIGGYFPSDFEVNILEFLEVAYKKNFKIVLPVIKSSTNMCFKLWNFKEPLKVNKFGILEPENSKKEIIPDIVMVPLVAFDKYLNRIGYGKGYYDRSLKKINKIKKKVVCVGIAYSFQECKVIPISKYDFKLDYIFTEQGIIK